MCFIKILHLRFLANKCAFFFIHFIFFIWKLSSLGHRNHDITYSTWLWLNFSTFLQIFKPNKGFGIHRSRLQSHADFRLASLATDCRVPLLGLATCDVEEDQYSQDGGLIACPRQYFHILGTSLPYLFMDPMLRKRFPFDMAADRMLASELILHRFYSLCVPIREAEAADCFQ
jgi:hypothetical protein